jgi:hypothetical protein
MDTVINFSKIVAPGINLQDLVLSRAPKNLRNFDRKSPVLHVPDTMVIYPHVLHISIIEAGPFH